MIKPPMEYIINRTVVLAKSPKASPIDDLRPILEASVANLTAANNGKRKKISDANPEK